MDLGIHLPLIPFDGQQFSPHLLHDAAAAARDCGFAAVSANDHLTFSTPWFDGPTALAAVAEHTGVMQLATTVALPVLRGSMPLAKSLAALDILCDGRLIAGLGPGSSPRDYDAVGIPFDDRWKRFDDAVSEVRSHLGRDHGRAIPLWIGSWGSNAGLERVARSADGWFASAYNTTPTDFGVARTTLARNTATPLPNAVATMWTWVTSSRSEEADRLEMLAALVNKDPVTIRDRVCIGSAEHCAQLLSDYADAGCHRVYLWPLGDQRRQTELVAAKVLPQLLPGNRGPSAAPHAE